MILCNLAEVSIFEYGPYISYWIYLWFMIYDLFSKSIEQANEIFIEKKLIYSQLI